MTVAGMLLSYGGSALDDYFEYVTMLLPGNGTNGAQNNTFLDSSTNNFTITRNGNTTQGTFTPYGSNWSNYFSGSGDYLTIADNAAFDFGSGDFTVECWIFRTGGGDRVSQVVYNQSVIGASSNSAIYLGAGNNGFSMYISTSGSAWTNNIVTATAASVGVWSHVVWQRRSNTLEIYLNGTLQTVASGSASFSGTIFNSTRNVDIGVQSAGSGNSPFFGYISNLRVVKGSAVYSSNFTPSTTPLTAISGTSLLTCQANRFVDSSSNAFSITLGGTPSVQRFSPFSPSAAYSAATIGGSGYFDGAGDYLSVADNAAFEVGSGNFTLECWFYATGSVPANGAVLVSKSNTSSYGPYTIAFSPTAPYNMQSYCSTTGSSWDIQINTSTTFTSLKNAWHHAALVRNGTAFNLYVDGVSIGSTTSSGTLIDNTNSFQISYINFVNTEFPGYISDVRLVKGTAVYTTTFTPPTAPLTAISNTSFLCNMTNAGIIDNAMISDGETVGGVQVSTAQSKFGGSSMLFNGTTGYLNFPASPNWVMKGDFTLECWFYLNTVQASMLFDQYTGAGAGLGDWQLYITAAGNVVWYYDNTTSVNTSFTVTTGQWYHIACTRASGSMRVFINGTQYGPTPTYTGQFGQNTTMWFGAQHLTGPSYFFAGYADDIRITNGYARYTANFTPPTAAFPTS